MDEVVTTVSDAADNTGSFNRIETRLVDANKDQDYPLHYAWERSGQFGEGPRSKLPSVESARFALLDKADESTFSEIEDLFWSVVKETLKLDRDIKPTDFGSFDANFGPTKVRLAIYEMSRRSTINPRS